MKSSLLTFFLVFVLSALVFSQTNSSPGLRNTHRFTLGLGHAQVSQGIINNKTRWLVLASWSFNYDYWLSDKWAVGLQNDMIVERFVVKDSKGTEFERNYPLSVVPVALYKAGKHWNVLGGIGREFAAHHNFTLTRLGVEYGIHLPGHWEVGAAVVWDNKWSYYNSWGIAFTVSKLYQKHR